MQWKLTVSANWIRDSSSGSTWAPPAAASGWARVVVRSLGAGGRTDHGDCRTMRGWPHAHVASVDRRGRHSAATRTPYHQWMAREFVEVADRTHVLNYRYLN